MREPNPGEAPADLYDLFVRGPRIALGGYGGGLEANLGDFVREALIWITYNWTLLGGSHFTTWARKLAMNVVLAELKRGR